MGAHLAREMRIRHPPEKDEVALPCMALLKPRPCRILLARASAEEEPISWSCSYTSASRSEAASASKGSCTCCSDVKLCWSKVNHALYKDSCLILEWMLALAKDATPRHTTRFCST